MKKLITVMLFVVAFTTTVNAQEAKSKSHAKNEICCSKHGDMANASAEEIAKCREKMAACTAEEKKNCNKNSSCCSGGKTPLKKA